MRWTPGGRSPNLEDRRGQSSGRFPFPGGMRVGGGLGLGTILLLAALGIVFKTDFLSLLTTSDGMPTGGDLSAPARPVDDPSEEPMVQFVSFVLDDAQNTWRQKSSELGTPYRDAKLVLFRDAVQSACGFAESATGPFYCPADEKVYIDLGFYEELQQRFGAPGDFAQAYVLAHEIGHHVQNLVGTEAQVREARQRRADLANELSVRLELQADCYAGVWGHAAAQRQRLEPGDVEEGLAAAAAVGDDRLQRMGGGRVVPESFTHGSSAQRQEWFQRGMETGRPDACDTFRQ